MLTSIGMLTDIKLLKHRESREPNADDIDALIAECDDALASPPAKARPIANVVQLLTPPAFMVAVRFLRAIASHSRTELCKSQRKLAEQAAELCKCQRQLVEQAAEIERLRSLKSELEASGQALSARTIAAEAAAEASLASRKWLMEERSAAEARAASAEAAAAASLASATEQRSAAEAAQRQIEELREALHCGLTTELFADPVCTSDGHCYEREAIEATWRAARETIEERARGEVDDECASCSGATASFEYRSPNTGAVVQPTLTPNHLAVRQIEALDQLGALSAEEAADWRARRGEALERQRRPASAPADSSRVASLPHAARQVGRSASFGRRVLSRASAMAAAARQARQQRAVQRAAVREERRAELARRAEEEATRKHSADEAATQEFLTGPGTGIRQCPACSTYLEKAGGCDHFTCRACSHEFCWACDASYRDIRLHGNAAHHRNCRHWRP